MKTLKSMSFDKKLMNSELKAIRGGNNQWPGAGCRCRCQDGSYEWIQYYMECQSTVTISSNYCKNIDGHGSLAQCSRVH